MRQLRQDLRALGRLTNGRRGAEGEWGSQLAVLLDRSIASLTAVIGRLEAGAVVAGSEDVATLKGRLPRLSVFAGRVAAGQGYTPGAQSEHARGA